MYICFEGVVGTGKTTQSKKLAEYLQKKYPERNVLRTREPGGTHIAEAIRTLVQGTDFEESMHPLTDAYLYTSSRAQSLHTLVKPCLDQGGIVVSDRCFCTTLAYQGTAQGLGFETIWNILRPAIADCLPDILLFMDLDIETGLSRTFDASGDKWERRGKEFFEKIYSGYQRVSCDERLTNKRIAVDASGSIDDVFDRIVEKLEGYLLRYN